MLDVLLPWQQQQVGLTDQRLGFVPEHVAEEWIDRHDMRIEIEFDHTVGPLQRRLPGQGFITIERLDVSRMNCWGIHGYDSFRSPTPPAEMREQEFRA